MTGIDPIGSVVRVLVVTACAADYHYLAKVLKGEVWALQHAPNLSVAGILIKEHSFACIVCDECLPDQSWHALLEMVHGIRSAPKLSSPRLPRMYGPGLKHSTSAHTTCFQSLSIRLKFFMSFNTRGGSGISSGCVEIRSSIERMRPSTHMDEPAPG